MQNRLLTFLQKLPTWFPVALGALLIRLPLILLPGAGRDEATYHYWAYHPEPAYSPLLQLAIRVSDWLPFSSLGKLRLPSILSGIIVIFLFDRWLQDRKIPPSLKILLLSTFALTPWQTYVGAILHPDNLLLLLILLFLILLKRRWYGVAMLVAGFACWAKLTGLLLLPVAIGVLVIDPEISRKSRFRYGIMGIMVALPVVVCLRGGMLAAMTEFGKIAPASPVYQKVLVAVLTILLLAGPALLIFSFVGVRSIHFRKRLVTDILPEQLAALLIALVLVAVFGAAAIFQGQIKGNWVLPALILLPPRQISLKLRRWMVSGLAISLLLSAGMVLALTHPGLLAKVEAHLTFLPGSYSLQAGTREARVSRTRSWAQRAMEYQSIAPFARQLHYIWQRERPRGAKFPRWIICDDYGLAAQLIYAWKSTGSNMIIPTDPLFKNTLPPLDASREVAEIMLLSVQLPLPRLSPLNVLMENAGTVRHPISKTPVRIAFLRNPLPPDLYLSGLEHPINKTDAKNEHSGENDDIFHEPN